MGKDSMKQLPERAVRLITRFFEDLAETDKEVAPSVLKSGGHWIATYDASILGAFYLNKSEEERVRQHVARDWPLFPGFMVAEGKKPAGAQVAIKLSGSCAFLSSNHTSNLFAFEVGPGSSFTVADHFHEIRDSSGLEFKYHVPLAFVLGISEGEQWPGVKRRLSELLNYSMGVWRKLR